MKTENYDTLRHSCAHLLAAAVEQLYPHALKTIGPSIENGFYFDFDFGDTKISDADLPAIEAKMHELASGWKSFSGREITVDEAKKLYKNNPYKLELIEEFTGEKQKLTIYTSGDYEDLCRGGHTQAPDKELKYFKLLNIAGAYWRGDEKNKMLTRIYGTCWPTQSELDTYLNMLEEAKKRDHKKLGVALDLFTFSDLVGAGLPLWTPKGTLMRDLLDGYVWELRNKKGYQRVDIPHITKKELYQVSGHWDKFADELFQIKTREGHEFVMKPMNCPHHTQIYNHLQRSYRDLPQRYSSTTKVYRDEQTGELSGLSRVRCITQDDAHVFCRETQVKDELLSVWDIVQTFYSSFGFSLKLRLSFHDPEHMEKYLGTEEVWSESESLLKSIAQEKGIEFYEAPGEAAFYGPKLDFMANDSLGRQWQIATIQLDRNMPERFDLFCINETGAKERIVMIHAAIMGSIERFSSILIEHFAGAFPTWLSPIQTVILPISDKHQQYAQSVLNELKSAGIRAELNDKNESLSARIRDAQLQKVPYMLVVGDKEMAANSVAERDRTGKDYGLVSVPDFVKTISHEIENRLIV